MSLTCSCGECRHFRRLDDHYDRIDGVYMALGKCAYPLPHMPNLPDAVEISRRVMLRDKQRFCTCFERPDP